MGIKHCRKGKVDSVLIAEHIGEPNCKHVTDCDPYGMGEQSGKCAKLDACSAAANAQAYVAKEQPAPKIPLPSLSQPLPTPLPPPVSQPMLFPPHASFLSLYTSNLPYYHYHYQPPHPLSQLPYSHSQETATYYPLLTYLFLSH